MRPGANVGARIMPAVGVPALPTPTGVPCMKTAETNDSTAVAFEKVTMSFGARAVFQDLTCRFERGKISVSLGGSGSGKSTLLRLVGGLVRPDSGSILVDGDDITQLGESAMYRVRQKLGMMFQGGALLDSLTVYDNLAFPLREHTDKTEVEIAAEVHNRLQAVGLAGVDELLPGQLSGGMTKRVALARAIIAKPRILLCDEPFSGLDPISVKRIEKLLVRINRQFDMTTLLVSHHVASTMRMADHVLVLLRDAVVSGTAEEMRNSDDPRVYNLLSDELTEDVESLESEVIPVAKARRQAP
jgi:phospholipid/cholesterol/gamma-HCH transport system ATP-binding protein